MGHHPGAVSDRFTGKRSLVVLGRVETVLLLLPVPGHLAESPRGGLDPRAAQSGGGGDRARAAGDLGG